MRRVRRPCSARPCTLNGLARVAQSAIGATPLPQASSSQQLRSVAGGMVVGEVPDEEAAETAGLLRSLLLQPAVLFDRIRASRANA